MILGMFSTTNHFFLGWYETQAKYKNLKFIFSKNDSMILIQFCRIIVHSNPNNITLSAFPGKFPEAVKINLKFLYFSCVSYQPKKKCFVVENITKIIGCWLTKISSKSIQWFSSSEWKKLANSETNFWKCTRRTCSVVFIPISLKAGDRPPRKRLSNLKSTAWINKSFHN